MQRSLLDTDTARYRACAVDVMAILLKAFGPLVRETCAAAAGPAAGLGVDVTFEERRDRCLRAQVCGRGGGTSCRGSFEERDECACKSLLNAP